MPDCTLHPDGTFELDGERVSIARIFDYYIVLHPDCTFDSIMLAVQAEPSIVDTLCLSKTHVFLASDVLREYLDFKDILGPDTELKALEFSWFVEFGDHSKTSSTKVSLYFHPVVSGLPVDSDDVDKYSISLRSPAALQGLPIILDNSLHYYSERFPDNLDNFWLPFKVGDVFKSLFEELTFHGLGLAREQFSFHMNQISNEIMQEILEDGPNIIREIDHRFIGRIFHQDTLEVNPEEDNS